MNRESVKKSFFPIISLIVILLIISLTAKNLYAEENFHGKEGQWEVYSTNKAGQKYCYIVTDSKQASGSFKRRSEPYLLVTYRIENGKPIPEISISSGYPYKQKSTVSVVIDTTDKYDLFTTSETPEIAWAKNGKEDIRLIENMKKGLKLKAKGYSRIGSYSIDEFSLSGFTAAYKKAKTLCRN